MTMFNQLDIQGFKSFEYAFIATSVNNINRIE